jgi:hypothetical protein
MSGPIAAGNFGLLLTKDWTVPSESGTSFAHRASWMPEGRRV